MTHAPTAPEDVLHRSLDLLFAKDMDGWVALCDEAVVVELPFAPPGLPRRLEGRTAVAAYLSDYPDHLDLRSVERLEVHHTTDPELVVAEMRLSARAVATDEPLDLDYVVLLTVRDGRIVRFRDYWNPLAMPTSMRVAKGEAA